MAAGLFVAKPVPEARDEIAQRLTGRATQTVVEELKTVHDVSCAHEREKLLTSRALCATQRVQCSQSNDRLRDAAFARGVERGTAFARGVERGTERGGASPGQADGQKDAKVDPSPLSIMLGLLGGGDSPAEEPATADPLAPTTALGCSHVPFPSTMNSAYGRDAMLQEAQREAQEAQEAAAAAKFEYLMARAELKEARAKAGVQRALAANGEEEERKAEEGARASRIVRVVLV